MNNFPIVVYTHTDMRDMWSMFFGQLRKYLNGYRVYVVVNKLDDLIPSEYTQVYYDDTKQYTERLEEALSKIAASVILFLHEDMILVDTPMHDSLQTYFEYVKNRRVRSIKLVYAGDHCRESSFDKTLVMNEYSKFSIQPTLIRPDAFLEILKNTQPMNIWRFEESISINSEDYMCKIGGEQKRGLYHYDSFVFPYIATAINKGKWNTTEYRPELNRLFSEYGMDPLQRGVV